MLGSPATTSPGFILGHSTRISVVRLFMCQMGVPSMFLLYLIDRWIKLQFLARMARELSEMSSQP